MEFLFECSTLYLKLNTQREIPYLQAAMYYPLYLCYLVKWFSNYFFLVLSGIFLLKQNLIFRSWN